MKRILRMIILTIISILSFITISMAVDSSYQIEVTANRAEVAEGETFEVIIEIDPTNVEGGIGAYTAEIKYDDSIFEITNLEGIGNWDTPIINNGKIIATTNDGECVTTKQEIAKITFIAKTDVINTISEIKVENFEASNTETILPAESKKVEMGKEQNGAGEEENNSNTNQQETNKNSENTVSSLILPFTGIKNVIIPVGILIRIAIIVVIFYYKKYRRGNK